MPNWNKPFNCVLSMSLLAPAVLQTIGSKTLYAGSAATQPSDAAAFTAEDLPLDKKSAGGELAQWLQPFDLPAEKFTYTLRKISSTDRYDVYRLVYPSPFKSPAPENNVVPAELYLPKSASKAKRVPAAIVLDILNGGAIIARTLAIGLAEKGVAALYMPMAYYGERRPAGFVRAQLFSENPQRSVDALRQSVMDARRAKAILSSLEQVDPHAVGITGVSLGGIVASLAAGIDGTFSHVLPILSGGDIAALTFYTRETHTLAQRLLERNIDQTRLAALLAPVEPLNFASRIDPSTCLMINASQDEVIPRKLTDRLREAMGEPPQLWVTAGHYSAIFYMMQIRQTAAAFFLGTPVANLKDPAFTFATPPSR